MCCGRARSRTPTDSRTQWLTQRPCGRTRAPQSGGGRSTGAETGRRSDLPVDRALRHGLGGEELLGDRVLGLALFRRLEVVQPQLVPGVLVELAVQLAAVGTAVELADETLVPH